MTHQTCSSCYFYLKHATEPHGQCYFNPPEISGNTPRVLATRQACGRFKENEALKIIAEAPVIAATAMANGDWRKPEHVGPANPPKRKKTLAI